MEECYIDTKRGVQPLLAAQLQQYKDTKLSHLLKNFLQPSYYPTQEAFTILPPTGSISLLVT
jgi:hypothetical protein